MILKNSPTLQLIISPLFLIIILLVSFPFQATAEEQYRFERIWPTLQQPWYFVVPSSIAVDLNGFVYVADTLNNRIQKFTSEGQFVAKWGSHGSEPGNLNLPAGLTVNSAGKVFVSDANNRLQVFKPVTQTSNNKAIIVAGGGPYQGNHLWDATAMCANFAYRTLTYQGFTKESIYYLTCDTDLDLDSNGVLDDVDGDATTNNLQQAIINWASGADDVVLYLVDHGGNGTFRMSDTETLSATSLDSWLDQVQQTINGKVVVIYDACESGSFLSSLKPPLGKQRIIISSTSPGENAYFVTQGSISFSNYFLTHIFNGLTIYDAFDLAHQAIGQTTGYQNPLLDDNGNGVGNETSDGSLARSTYIGNGTVIYGEAPVIGSVSAAQTLNNTSTASLYAVSVTDADGIARVWAIIRPPDYSPSNPDNPVQNLPSFDLMPVGGDRYEGTYQHFNIPGTYQIAIYARDRIGNTSIPKLTTVSITNPLPRKAIIVAGGSQTDALWTAIENNSVLAYGALTYQGYKNEDIYFLSPVTISTGVDGLPTISNLNYAITTWARGSQDLVLYLVGNGDEGIFKISPTENLSATQLDSWLDSLQNTIPGKVTVIYDSCQSGSFLPLLNPPSGKERILLASTGEDKPAYFLSEGVVSFSNYFWRKILNGTNVRDAFIHAKQAISFSCEDQTPFIDDNGNGIGNQKEDGNMARNYTIGVGIMLAGDDPIIGSVSSPQTLNGETTAIILANNVTTTGTIDEVFAVITPPNSQSRGPVSPITELPTIKLWNTGSRYEGTYNAFCTTGTYQIAVYALDDNGNLSLPQETTLTQSVSGEAKFYFPHIAFGSGWETEIAIINTS